MLLTAIAQGWQPWQLAEKLRLRREVARSLLSSCMHALPGLQAFVDEQWEVLRRRGHVTSLAARLCGIPPPSTSDPKVSRPLVDVLWNPAYFWNPMLCRYAHSPGRRGVSPDPFPAFFFFLSKV